MGTSIKQRAAKAKRVNKIIGYKIEGDHPILARIDEFRRTEEEAERLKTRLDGWGYEVRVIPIREESK